MMTYDAMNDIDTSVQENRIVTLYPESQSEFDAMCEVLTAECDDYADVSGSGYGGPESNGWVDFWGGEEDGREWRINVVNP